MPGVLRRVFQPTARTLVAAQGLFAFAFPLLNVLLLFLPMGWGAALLGPIYVSAFIPPFSFITGPLAVLAAWRMAQGKWWPFAIGLGFEALWLVAPLQQIGVSHTLRYFRGPGPIISICIGLTGVALIVLAALARPRHTPPGSPRAPISVRPAIAGLAAGGLVLLVVAAFALFLIARSQPISYNELISHPEARLYYPGSEVISASGAGEEQGLDVHTSASFNSHLRVAASPADILSWYQHELESRGWILRQSDAYAVPSRAFSLDRREVMRIGIAPDGTYSTTFTVLPSGCEENDTTFHNCTGF